MNKNEQVFMQNCSFGEIKEEPTKNDQNLRDDTVNVEKENTKVCCSIGDNKCLIF
jgi:hypothetical protein